jgi:membrane protease YdiL (CAAX protease family)
VLIARVQPAVGTGQTLLMTSALFGLGHWFGHPSGPTGVLLAGFAGWFWGKAMIETKGFTWSWLIHAAQDVAIVAFIIMAGR